MEINLKPLRFERRLSRILTHEQIAECWGYVYAGEDLSENTYDKIFNWYAFILCEMPIGIAKARDGDPYEWIREKLHDLFEFGMMNKELHFSHYGLEVEGNLHLPEGWD